MNESSVDTPRRRTSLIVGGLVVGGVLLLLIPTCRGPENGQRQSQTAESLQEDSFQENCDRTLSSALDGLRPHRLGLSSESRVMANTLNQWLSQCPDADAAVENEADAQLRQELLSENALANTQQQRFQELDAAHIRNSLLAKAIVEEVTQDLTSDRERAVELFYFVIRTIELTPDSAAMTPFTPYESLLFGRGSAADRAWTFAMLLRQLRLDSAVLIPQNQRGSKPYWLIGVVTPGEGIALFDTRLGLPIALADDGSTPLPRQPATLSQARADDDLLRQFDAPDASYPLSAEALESLDVLAIGTSSTWAPRMEILQSDLGEPVELFDGLGSSRFRATGLHERLVNAGSDGLWSAEQVKIWDYPESRWADAAPLTVEQQKVLDAGMRILEGPFDIHAMQTEAGVELSTASPDKTLREARIEQLMGDHETARPLYMRCRIKPQDPQQINLQEVQLNYLAAEMAEFWIAQSQFEQGDYQAAVGSCELYMKQRPNSQFILSALFLRSLCLAHLGDRAEASELLAQEPPQAPQHAGNQQLVARWSQAGDAVAPADDPGDEASDSP